MQSHVRMNMILTGKMSIRNTLKIDHRGKKRSLQILLRFNLEDLKIVINFNQTILSDFLMR